MSLSLRQPAAVWVIGALLPATLLHGLCWMGVLIVMGSPAFAEIHRQVVLSLFWMGGALLLWRVSGAQSRLHALFTVLGCALFVTVAGSVAAFAKLHFIDRIELDPSFYILSAVLAVGHLVIAVPSSLLLQQVALKRVPKP